MEDKITFEEMYEAYILCLKNKKRKAGTYKFVNDNLCENLMDIVMRLNQRTYIPNTSNCYVITEPALREIYAAEFSDRVVQHFYMKEIEDILDGELVDGCCSCRKQRGTDYALKLLKKYLVETSKYGKEDCFFLKIDLSGYFMSIDRKQVGEKFSKLISEKYNGKHKELLSYLTPLIFENNPALNCKYKCNESMREQVPERRKMKKDSKYGMAIGNLTAQAYHGVPFLGKVSYPYGYQKPSKQVIIRICQKAKEVKNIDGENLLAKTNSQIGSLKNYNCRKLILDYVEKLPEDIKNILNFNSTNYKFSKNEVQ